MLFVFHGKDGAGSADKRSVNYPAHHAHLDNTAAYNVNIVMSGPLVADDGKTPVGSLLIIEAPDRQSAENYFHSDPFYTAGLWDETHISAFKKTKG